MTTDWPEVPPKSGREPPNQRPREPRATARRSSIGGWRPNGRQLLQSILGLAVALALIVWGLPHFAETSWDKVFAVLEHVGPGAGVGLLLLMLAGLWMYTFTLTGSLPGLSHPRALIVNVCGSSIGNLLPGGGAAGVATTYALCRSWGFGRRDISTSIIVSGVWNVLARVALPVIGIGALLANAAQLPLAVVRGGVIGAIAGTALLAIFVGIIASARVAGVVGRGLDKALRKLRVVPGRRLRGGLAGSGQRGAEVSIDELIVDLRARITSVVRTGWIPMSAGLLGYFGMWFVLFVFCLRAVNVDLPISQAFAAYAVGRLLTAVGFTPGGLGVTESGTVAILVAWGADGTAAAAAVVLFAVYTHLMEIPLGALGWAAWSLTPKQLPRRAPRN